jgi:hypothetical protein
VKRKQIAAEMDLTGYSASPYILIILQGRPHSSLVGSVLGSREGC